MPIGDLYRVADQYQAQLRRRDAATLQQLAQAYGRIYQQATANFELVNQFILAKLEANQIVTAGRVIRSAQGRELIQQTRTSIDSYGEFAAGVVSNAQEQAAVAALTESERLLRVGLETGLAETVQLPGGRTLTDILPAFQRVPTEAVNQLVGTLGDGTPLRDYFLGGTANVPALSDDVVDSIKDMLSHGLAAGWNPQKTARMFRQAMGVGLTRAMRIARTETLRSYREASRMNYVANGIEEWEWLATLDARTCLACLALDGTTYPTDQPQQSHPQCRCTMVPVLPFDVPRVRRISTAAGGGEFDGMANEWFDTLTEDTQRGIMGPGKFDLLQQGYGLSDFVGRHEHATFGTSFVERSIKDVLGGGASSAPQGRRISGPSGTPVSQAIQIPATGKYSKPYKAALDSIDSVHGDGELPEIPVTSKGNMSYLGTYSYYKSGDAVGIAINGKSDHDHIQLTLAHETGHFIDQQTLGKNRVPATRTEIRDGVLAQWKAAIDKSKVADRLQDMQANPDKYTFEKPDPKYDFIVNRIAPNQKTLRYLAGTDELWARSYAQYVATKSGNQNMLDEVTRLRSGELYGPVFQWDDDDFKPIMKAIDDIFRGLGWLT